MNCEGEKRTSIELEIDEIGPSLRYATAQVTRTSGGGQARQAQVADEPWSTPGSAAGSAPAAQSGGADAWAAPGAYGDDTPF